MVRRVREVLRLQRETVALAVDVATGADQCAVEEIAGIELDSRLVGPEFEHPARAGVFDTGGKARLAPFARFEDLGESCIRFFAAQSADRIDGSLSQFEIIRGL